MTPADHRALMFVRSLARKIDRSLAALELRLTADARSDKMAVIDGHVEGASGARPGAGIASVAEPTQLLLEDEDGYQAGGGNGSEEFGAW